MTDEDILANLKADIEALGEGHPMWAKSAYTHRGTLFEVFVNGVQVAEGQEYIFPNEDLKALADATLIAIKAYRQRFLGAVRLVWRGEPRVEIVKDSHGRSRVSLYTRLCFEEALTEVAKGVWVVDAKRWGA